MDTCLEKQNALWELFQSCKTPEAKYTKIIELGKSLPPIPNTLKTKDSLVAGCQSKTYLLATLKNNVLHFSADSDALISKGLAALLIKIYNEESLKTLFTSPPLVLKKLNIFSSLSPLRANGLKAMYQKMQEIAISLSSVTEEISPLVHPL